jgi:hypothetical protein
MPKFLFEGELENLTNDARVLYSLLRDRHELSIKNHWVNSEGEVYLIFSRENMCGFLKLCEKTITKAMNTLKKYNLIEEQRRGLGKPNLIYLLNPEMNPESIDFPKNRNIYGSGTEQFTVLEPKNFPPNDTEFKDTEFNYNILSYPYPSVYPDSQKTEPDLKTDLIRGEAIHQRENDSVSGTQEKDAFKSVDTVPSATATNYDTIAEIIRNNIEFENIAEEKSASPELLNEIVHVIASTVCAEFKDGYISMGEERVPAVAVKGVFMKLGREDAEYFIECYDRQTSPITKLTSYIRTSLYRNFGTKDHYWTNRVHVDMPNLAAGKIQSKNAQKK